MSGGIIPGVNSLPKVAINCADVYVHGAHVTSWRSTDGRELLWLSKKAIFNPPTAIRGGIPVCWPQFSDMGPIKTAHGFARNRPWTCLSQSSDSVTFALQSDESTLSFFPCEFLAELTVTTGDDKLTQTLTIRNPSASESLSFTVALHTYLRVTDVAQVSVKGLHNINYLDNLQNRASLVDTDKEVTFHGEMDRIYVGAPNMIKVQDGEGRAFIVRKSGFKDAVVWNPYIQKAKAMSDFGDEEWKDMVCVEVANAGSGPVVLKPGSSWSGEQTLEYTLLD